MRIDYTLTPQARISAGRGAQVQNVRTIHQVIPGSVVRGALGAAWWGPTDARFKGGAAQSDFDNLFARLMDVHAAVPGLNVDGRVVQASFEPLSWAKCKYRGEPGCDSSWHDQAVAVLEGSGDWLQTCPSCRQPVDHPKHGWSVDPGWNVATTRTALTNGLAEDDMLFTPRAMVKEVTYRGTLRLASEPGPHVLEWLLQNKVIRVGGQRSTMGTCLWEAVVSPENLPRVSGNCVVQVRSPAILIDDFGAPSLDLAAALSRILRSHAGKVRQVWTRPEVITGWHGIAGLPKPSEWAIAAGSVALIEGATATIADVLDAGIGLRRREGYGQLLVQPVSAADPSEAERGDAQAGAAVDVAETSHEPQTPPGPLDVLRRLLPEGIREQTFRAMLAEAQRIKQLREGGFPDHIVTQRIEGLVRRPWVRDLSGETQQAVAELLGSRSLSETLSALTVAIDEGESS